jgi:hypothetical protein
MSTMWAFWQQMQAIACHYYYFVSHFPNQLGQLTPDYGGAWRADCISMWLMRRYLLALPAFAALLLRQSLLAQQLPQTPTVIKSFVVQDLDNRPVRYSVESGKVAVVVFVSARCPISNAFNFRLNSLYQQFGAQADFFIVDSNANEPAGEVGQHAKEMQYDFAVYLDPNNALADLLGARATPDSFVIDHQGRVSYHGYIEDGLNPERTKNPALRLAIDAALTNKPAPIAETHSRGCAIRRAKPAGM